ncbi:MAG: hypothetical protein GWP10_18320, partial [Nitrospiraceae bacterium]|nr:hypothetical protein [Nitrospiraceae bacterium]
MKVREVCGLGPVDEKVVNLTGELRRNLVKLLVEIGEAVSPGGVEQHEMPASEKSGMSHQVVDVEVTVRAGALDVLGGEEGTFEKHDLGREDLWMRCKEAWTGIGTVREQRCFDGLCDGLPGGAFSGGAIGASGI